MTSQMSNISSEEEVAFMTMHEYLKSYCCRYVHVLVQKMAVNVDLGFILSIINFFSFMDQQDLQIEVCILYG